MLRFYVYVLKLEDGTVFYVGKGTGQRLFWHRRVLSRPQIKEYQRGVYKRMRAFIADRAFVEEKIFETNNETEALLHEQVLIQNYGFENLVNTQTHAFTGRKLKPEVGQLIASRLRGKKLSIEHRAKISAGGKGRVASIETRQKLSASISKAYGGSFTATHCAALSLAAKTRKQRSAKDELKRLKALRRAVCGKPRDLTKARLSRPFSVYALRSPSGDQWYAFSNGLLKLLADIGLATTTFYRAVREGNSAGWSVVKA
jgi:hypothetical protein